MADVHRFGHIGRAVIDDDGFGNGGRFDTESVVFEEIGEE